MSSFLINLFYTSAIISLVIKIVLLYLNINYIKKNKNIPKYAQGIIDNEQHIKAQSYTTTKNKFSIMQNIFSTTFLCCIFYFNLFDYIDAKIVEFTSDTNYQSVFFLFTLSVFSFVLNLPFSIYSTFVIEEKYGFNKTTAKIFIIDILKSAVLNIILLTPIYLFLLFIIKSSPNWWVIALVTITSFQFILIWAYPKFIAPFFNKFIPLQNSELENKITALGEKIDINFTEYYVMNASMRSSHGNAYFTGFGKNRRIVFFDTLLKTLSNNEVLAVLAHELGHLKHGHIKKYFITSILFLGLGLFVLNYLLSSGLIFEAFNIQNEKNYIGLFIFLYFVPQVTYFFTPIGSLLSRKNEFEADEFSCKYTDGNDLISALMKMYRDNSSSLTPHPLFSTFYYSHPPALERINFIKSKI